MRKTENNFIIREEKNYIILEAENQNKIFRNKKHLKN